MYGIPGSQQQQNAVRQQLLVYQLQQQQQQRYYQQQQRQQQQQRHLLGQSLQLKQQQLLLNSTQYPPIVTRPGHLESLNYANANANANAAVATTGKAEATPPAISTTSKTPLRPLLVTDLQPSVLAVFQRLIREYASDYLVAYQEGGNKKARPIITGIYYSLLASCASFDNVEQGLPSEERFVELIRTSLGLLMQNKNQSVVDENYINNNYNANKDGDSNGNNGTIQPAKVQQQPQKQQETKTTNGAQEQEESTKDKSETQPQQILFSKNSSTLDVFHDIATAFESSSETTPPTTTSTTIKEKGDIDNDSSNKDRNEMPRGLKMNANARRAYREALDKQEVELRINEELLKKDGKEESKKAKHLRWVAEQNSELLRLEEQEEQQQKKSQLEQTLRQPDLKLLLHRLRQHQEPMAAATATIPLQENPWASQQQQLLQQRRQEFLVGQEMIQRTQMQFRQQRMQRMQLIQFLQHKQEQTRVILSVPNMDPVMRCKLAEELLNRQALIDAEMCSINGAPSKVVAATSQDGNTTNKETGVLPSIESSSFKRYATKQPFDTESRKNVTNNNPDRKIPVRPKATSADDTETIGDAKQATSEHQGNEQNDKPLNSSQAENTAPKSNGRKRKRPMTLPLARAQKTKKLAPKQKKSLCPASPSILPEDSFDEFFETEKTEATTKKKKPPKKEPISMLKKGTEIPIKKMKKKKKESTLPMTRAETKTEAHKGSSQGSSIQSVGPDQTEAATKKTVDFLETEETEATVKKKKIILITEVKKSMGVPKQKKSIFSSILEEKNDTEKTPLGTSVPKHLPPSVQKALKLLAPHNVPGHTTAGDNEFILDNALSSSTSSSRRASRRKSRGTQINYREA